MSFGTIPLQVALDALGPEGKLHESYSGRAMYGDTCFGVVGSRAECFVFLAGLANAFVMNEGDPEAAIELAEVAQMDNMGLDLIMYFPGWTIEREAQS